MHVAFIIPLNNFLVYVSPDYLACFSACNCALISAAAKSFLFRWVCSPFPGAQLLLWKGRRVSVLLQKVYCLLSNLFLHLKGGLHKIPVSHSDVCYCPPNPQAPDATWHRKARENSACLHTLAQVLTTHVVALRPRQTFISETSFRPILSLSMPENTGQEPQELPGTVLTSVLCVFSRTFSVPWRRWWGTGRLSSSLTDCPPLWMPMRLLFSIR